MQRLLRATGLRRTPLVRAADAARRRLQRRNDGLPLSWDERGYLSMHPDVAAEVSAGRLSSGYAHWLGCGYAERRALPYAMAPALQLPRALLAQHWDDAAYLAANPHVGPLVALGLYEDGLAHFWGVHLQQTPKLPLPGSWDEAGYLWLHEDIAGNVRGGAFASGYEHWLRHGAQEGRLLLAGGAAMARAAAEAHGGGATREAAGAGDATQASALVTEGLGARADWLTRQRAAGQTPSAAARYYLALARQAGGEGHLEAGDVAAPAPAPAQARAEGAETLRSDAA